MICRRGFSPTAAERVGVHQEIRRKSLVWYETYDMVTDAIQRETPQALAAKMETGIDRKNQPELG